MLCFISLVLEFRYKVFHKKLNVRFFKNMTSIAEIPFLAHKEGYLEISNNKYSGLEEPPIGGERLI